MMDENKELDSQEESVKTTPSDADAIIAGAEIAAETPEDKEKQKKLEEAAKELDKIETISADVEEEEKNAEYTENKAEKPKRKRKFHWWIIVVAVLLVALIAIFVVWFLSPDKKLNVVVLDKTVLTLDDEEADYNEESLYRKHQGLFWLLNQQKYVKEDGTEYNYKEDYYGTMLDAEGKLSEVTELSECDSDVDLLYVADVYGAIDDDYGYYNGSIGGAGSGLTSDDMMEIYSAHESGATIVAEMETFHTSLSDSVSNQLQSLCGITSTSWVGRYIVDLADLTDVPDWAPPMYFEQEGVEWQFSGPGILLVGEGEIIVLEQKTDFESSDLLRIYVNDDYKDEFSGIDTCDFYNWFELVTANNGTDVIATFEFDVNATGMEKLKDFNTEPRFVAVTRKDYDGGAPVYYFAGDFNDYVNHLQFYKFMFADSFYRLTTYERQGDISNFFWNFYNPLMKKVLKDSYNEAKDKDNSQEEKNTTEVSKLENGAISVYSDDAYHPVSLNAVSISAVEPGSSGSYSTDREFYAKLVEEAVTLGANTIYVKDLLPAEFYSAVYENNKDSDSKLYIIQAISAPDGISSDNCTSDTSLEAWKTKIENVVGAVHGGTTVEASGTTLESSYKISIADDVIAFVIDPDITASFIANFSAKGYNYSGTYASGVGVEGYVAYLYDTLETAYVNAHNNCNIPIGIETTANTVGGTTFANTNSVFVSEIVSDTTFADSYLFNAVPLNFNSPVLSSDAVKASGESYDRYAYALSEIASATENRFLVTDIKSSVNITTFSSVLGQTEREQGNSIVSMLTAVNSFGSVGGVIYDLNDNWSAVSSDYSPLMTPSESVGLWHNVTDPASMTGLVSIEQSTPSENEMVLADDDRMQHMYFSSNGEYLYITMELLTEIEYDKETLFIGIDTYQRNDGEYYFASDFVATSLSGMEYVIRFDDKQEVSLWVAEGYDRSTGNYVTKESYTAKYDKVADLVYGGFGSTQNQFYQTGATIYIRIPWLWLNITDPSQRMVLNNTTSDLGEKANAATTNGILFSVMIGDIETKDVLYQFPEQKSDPGYKTYKWTEWTEVTTFDYNERDSYDVVKNYFSGR